MKRNTYLTEAITTAEMKAQYDAEAKKIVADKGVLSWIVKHAVKEMKNYTLNEIANAIEDIEVALIPVYRFHVITPKKERIKLILNVEIQRDYYPGYDPVTRAVFYCARMLSSQLDTEFSAEDYDDIKKVYSIWLCLNAPKKEADTIVEYAIEPHIIFGGKENGHRYDLLSVVMIGLNEESYKNMKTTLHGFLGTVFSEKLKPSEKLRSLEEDYWIKTTREIKEGVGRMWNLSDGIFERGEEQKLIELVCKKVKKGKTLEIIAQELEEETDSVAAIYEAVLNAAPDYDIDRIREKIHHE